MAVWTADGHRHGWWGGIGERYCRGLAAQARIGVADIAEAARVGRGEVDGLAARVDVADPGSVAAGYSDDGG